MAESPYIVTRGVVLRQTETGDADKILTLLTEDRGKIAAIARGVRKKNCKFSAAAQPLVLSQWTLWHQGDWYHVNAGETEEEFRGLRNRLEAMALGSYFAELSEAAAVEEVPAGPLLRHLLNGLYALSALNKPPEVVKPAFELRLMCYAGYEPALGTCAVCGRPDPAEPCLDVQRGVLLCRTCAGPEGGIAVRDGAKQGGTAGQYGTAVPGGTAGRGTARPYLFPLCQDSLAAARHAVLSDPRRLYAFRLDGPALGRLSAAAEAFVLTQMERRFRTLDYYKALMPEGTQSLMPEDCPSLTPKGTPS